MLAAPAISQAALTLNNTRIVFNGDKRSTSVIVKNPSKSTYAVQTWINTVADDTTTAVPFEVSGQGQQHTLNNTDMLEPFAEHAYPLTGIKPAPGLQAQFSVINDYGGYTEPLTLPIHLPN
ncbi:MULTISPECIES: fimbria/pilus periplasmic chaperone [unclassified Pseudomonas]|nr:MULTISPECIES: fimbria/pilus periplasmic chaperone [unclassified Pseudomonas]SMF44965.1 P pilus assembly protein, chaperone PapD [Pseudomonas sp. LAIL14HWK12:I11]SMR79515.1 P pilus assembly protein, chaperone PapD [Pseudomonas sp. LAIL14HWK12:I10]SOD05512.1 P pilus assembly protein, chaperone PapD [Pseudomonas sp. LAIL14HWK12:I8]